MRAIQKGIEPSELTEYRNQVGAKYNGGKFASVKDAIRKQLLREQGFLCSYCMSRIYDDKINTKIEHWHSKSPTKYPLEQLRYINLLAVCRGNKGRPLEEQHCDTRKGDNEIRYNPSDPSHRIELKIKYLGEGTITSNDNKFNKQINNVLNLNFYRLKENRKNAIEAIGKILNKKPGTRTPKQIRKLINTFESPDTNGMLSEYCGAVIYWLRKKL